VVRKGEGRREKGEGRREKGEDLAPCGIILGMKNERFGSVQDCFRNGGA
jgi:hypothetical protein